MRRLVPVLVLILSGCSSPAIRVSPRFDVGDARVYLLQAEAVTRVDTAGERRTETTSLTARARIQVVSTSAGEATLRLTLTPTRFRIGGKAGTPPSEQEVEVVVGSDGALRRVERIGGLPPETPAGDVEEFAPLLGASFPPGRLRLGDRWTRRLPPVDTGEDGPVLQQGTQRGRVAALRRVQGLDCAVLAVVVERPIVRSQQLEGRSLTLVGTEFASSEIAFAFRRGYQVRISTASEARFTARSEGLPAGSVTIEGRTTLSLQP